MAKLGVCIVVLDIILLEPDESFQLANQCVLQLQRLLDGEEAPVEVGAFGGDFLGVDL
jgi:hypothetical protein